MIHRLDWCVSEAKVGVHAGSLVSFEALDLALLAGKVQVCLTSTRTREGRVERHLYTVACILGQSWTASFIR